MQCNFFVVNFSFRIFFFSFRFFTLTIYTYSLESGDTIINDHLRILFMSLYSFNFISAVACILHRLFLIAPSILFCVRHARLFKSFFFLLTRLTFMDFEILYQQLLLMLLFFGCAIIFFNFNSSQLSTCIRQQELQIKITKKTGSS